MPTIGPLELVVVLVIALIVLGPKRLPEAGRSLGQGLRGFKDSMTGLTPIGLRSEDRATRRRPVRRLPHNSMGRTDRPAARALIELERSSHTAVSSPFSSNSVSSAAKALAATTSAAAVSARGAWRPRLLLRAARQRAPEGREGCEPVPAAAPIPGAHTTMSAASRVVCSPRDLGPLLEELLDAHLDTLELLADGELSVRRLSHVDYLRALYRYGQAWLAEDEQPAASDPAAVGRRTT